MKLTRQQIYDMLWEKGTGAVQKELGLAYSELRKMCEELNIPRPTSGYWSALNFGKLVEKAVLPHVAEDLPEDIETDIYRCKHTKVSKSTIKTSTENKENISVQKTPSDPQTSKKEIEPEVIDSEETVNNDSIFTVPEILYAKDPIIFDTIAKHRERVYEDDNEWGKKNPFKCKAEDYLEIHVSNEIFDRALRIFYTIIKAARSFGYDIDTKHKKNRNDYYEGGTYFIVKGERISVDMDECNRQVPTPEDKWYKFKLAPSGELRFRIRGRWSHENKYIKDTKCTRLEDKIENIIQALEKVADERIEEERQQKIREEERRIEEERKRREEEARKLLEALRQAEREKVMSLLIDVERYSVANQMYEYIKAYKDTLKTKGVEISTEIQENIDWVQNKADWMNPFLNQSDDILSDSDFKKILHPKTETKPQSYFSSWNEPKEREYNFWQMKNMFWRK